MRAIDTEQMEVKARLRQSGRGIAEMEAAPKATSRHTQPPLPLLPSGPGGVRSLALREDLRGHHSNTHELKVYCGAEFGGYALI